MKTPNLDTIKLKAVIVLKIIRDAAEPMTIEAVREALKTNAKIDSSHACVRTYLNRMKRAGALLVTHEYNDSNTEIPFYRVSKKAEQQLDRWLKVLA